ncbi:cytochrome p450 [Seiridium cupressi]
MSAKTADRPLTVHYRAKLLPWSLVLAPYGEQCHRLRKIYHHILGQAGATIFRKWSEEETLFMLKTLAKSPDQAHFECDRHGFNITMRVIYGVRYGPEGDHKIRETFQLWEQMFCYFLPGSLIFDYFPSLLELAEWLQPWLFTFQGLKRRERGIHDEHLRIIERCGGLDGKFPEYGSTTFAAQLLKMTQGINLDDQAIIDVLSMLLGAGADTISGFLQQFFKAMAVNPEAVIRAQAEIDSVIGASRLPSWEDKSNLPYVRSLIKEVHRWAPFAAAGIPHSTTEEITYQNYVIPKGTVLLPNIPAMMRSDERYVQPDKFEPARFMDDDTDSATSAHSPDWPQRDHVHFGWGRRLCPGIYAADICIFLAVSRILWGFSIQPHPDYQVRMEDVSG